MSDHARRFTRLGLIAAMLIVMLVAVVLIQPAQARGHVESRAAQTTPAPTPTPDATVVALQAQVNAQATQIANLEQSIANKIDRLEIDITRTYLPLTIVALVVAALGIPLTGWAVYKYGRDQAKKMIDKAIYQIDPVNALVHVPKDFAQGQEYLKWRGFYKFRTYQTIDNTCLEDCVVVVANTEQDFVDFRAFLKKYSLDPRKVAYVIYTQLRGPADIVDDFPNITYANSLVTLGTNLFTIARSLIR